MFFVISKLIGFLVSPFWWIIVSVGLAYIIKNRVYKARLYLLAFVLFAFFTNPLLFSVIAGAWEGDLQPAESMRGKSDVCVVLGGMSAYHEPTNRIRFTQSADRILQAVDLYKKGIVSKIVISGGTSRLIQKTRPESIHLKEFLVTLGIPSGEVLIDSLSRNTYENGINSMKLIKANGWNRRVVLVTSAFHMRRAAGCFIKAGFTVYPYTTDPLKGVSSITFSDVVIPSVGVLNNWNFLIREWVGIVMYWLNGYL